VIRPTLVERAKLFFFRHFERIFVLLLVGAIVVIHAIIEQKFAFLSFYYLPVILAGFYGGRRFAVVSQAQITYIKRDLNRLEFTPWPTTKTTSPRSRHSPRISGPCRSRTR